MRRLQRHRAAVAATFRPRSSRQPDIFSASPSHRIRPLQIRLAWLSATICAALFTGTVETQNAVANGDTRTLSLVHEHTRESASITFKRDGRYDRAALDQLNWLLRDWRQNESTKMDPRLFDVVWEAQRSIGSTQPLRIVCGYRSPKTNGMLRARSSGVAEHSQHMLGKAMDFFMTDASIDDLRAAGVRLQRGGVGWYPRSGSPFVHLDVGSVRAWPRMTRDQLARIFPDGKTVHLPTDGKPLARYEEARAEILARGGTVLGYTAVANADPYEDGAGIKGFFAGLFGGGGPGATPAQVPEATPGKARGKSTIAVASADPEDATGAKQALAYVAPTSSEALRDAMLQRDGREAPSQRSLLTGSLDKASTAGSASIPLPPRRPAEFAAITAALGRSITRTAETQVASLDNSRLSELANLVSEDVIPARLVPATADAREQFRALFDGVVQGASEPASDTVPVHVTLAQAKPIETTDTVFSPLEQVPSTRFSPRSPGDHLAASQFSGSATGVVAGLR